MPTPEDWGVIAYHIVNTAIKNHGEAYVRNLVSNDPHYLVYRGEGQQ